MRLPRPRRAALAGGDGRRRASPASSSRPRRRTPRPSPPGPPAASPAVALGWAATTKFDILWAMQNAFDDIADHEAREALFLAAPHLSAKHTITRPQVASVAIALGILLLGLATAPMPTVVFVSGFVTVFYMLSFGFRFLLTWVGAHDDVDISVTPEEVADAEPGELPVYTVLVPMYREAEVLPLLVHSHPPPRLSARQARREAGARGGRRRDHRGRQGAEAAEGNFEIIRVPTSQPKTKPKACNYALQILPWRVPDASTMPRTSPSPTSSRRRCCAFRDGRAEPRLRPGAAQLLQPRRKLADGRMFTLEYAMVRLPAARARLAEGADPAGRHVQPLQAIGILRERRCLGPLQRHRGCRSRRPAGAGGLHGRRHQFDDLRGGQRRAAAAGSTSAAAGSRATCRPGWCICATRCGSTAPSGFVGFCGFQFFIGFPVLTVAGQPDALVHDAGRRGRAGADVGERSSPRPSSTSPCSTWWSASHVRLPDHGGGGEAGLVLRSCPGRCWRRSTGCCIRSPPTRRSGN